MLEILLIMGALSGGVNQEVKDSDKNKPLETKTQVVSQDKKVKK